jgi:ankyrin repeat domain-containing protein 50
MNGWTALMNAAQNGKEAGIKALLEVGDAQVDANDDSGQTALMLAAENGHEAAIKVLLEIGKA